MMQPFILISILVFLLIVVGALILVAIAMRRSSIDSRSQGGQELHPRGYWVSIGISIGAGLGVALGLVFDNLALGIAIGVAIGVSIGGALEQKNKEKFRPLSEQEQKTQKWGVALSLLILLVFAGTFIFILVMRSR